MAKRATDWDRRESIEPEDAHVPRTDAETDSSIEVTLRRMSLRMAVGFAILTLGLVGGLKVNNYEVCKSRGESVTQINDTIGGILRRLDSANKLQYEKGNVTYAERQMAHAFYAGELRQLPVAIECKVV